MRPIKADYDKASSQPWSTTTCLIAQMMIRHGVAITRSAQAAELALTDPDLHQLMIRFDTVFGPGRFTHLADKKAMAVSLRACLPDSEDVIEEVTNQLEKEPCDQLKPILIMQ